ncbi:MAG: hypothetical protein M1838_004138 [Thelocarpon superellum]|nr:MAG: hypothetical protein M1838_004138 [Thelocarpon superellum]
MRPPRLILLLLCFIALPIFVTLLSLLGASRGHGPKATTSSTEPKTGIRALFSFHSPFSLFPPSAIISLTDENSTFFLARPAAFGPLLSPEGLSGRLWVGSGFGDDNTGRGGGAVPGAEGELGCSDVPGWSHGMRKPGDGGRRPPGQDPADDVTGIVVKPEHRSNDKRRRSQRAEDDMEPTDEMAPAADDNVAIDDGTDDYLHHPLPSSDVLQSSKPGQIAHHVPSDAAGKSAHHADIQSLQESAEIAGQIVLLSRGGCGFLEKVKWVQRRGGIALIVGDNTRGGGLVTMYAQGDTSNVSIPSLFTSHTTAHLLSSLIPPERSPEEGTRVTGLKAPIKESGRTTPVLSSGMKAPNPAKDLKDRPTFTPSRALPRPTMSSRMGKARGNALVEAETPFPVKENTGWLRSALAKLGLVGGGAGADIQKDSRRPPSSGQLNWVLVEDWAEDAAAPAKANPSAPASNGTPNPGKKGGQGHKTGPAGTVPVHSDGFVIGVQDWRDPDLIGLAPPRDGNSPAKPNAKQPSQSSNESKTQSSWTLSESKPVPKHGVAKTETDRVGNANALKGGSITPGSGEYERPEGVTPDNRKAPSDGMHKPAPDQAGGPSQKSEHQGWFNRMPWHEDDGASTFPDDSRADPAGSAKVAMQGHAGHTDDSESYVEGSTANEDSEHEGLWVTLTPTTMSASPFFDTLLVLVVSPLVTLTVVYALLLLRSRIRRRRWRAPKSVVERLPVRTYQTISPASSIASTRVCTSTSDSASSPLLETEPSRPRPRSRTASSVLVPAEVPRSSPIAMQSPASTRRTAVEKSPLTSPEWRRRYTGRQVECVVCLEEYVHGVSRVMSLPCGHEFHAECMYVTPSVAPPCPR